MRSMRVVSIAALFLFAVLPAAASAAPTCAEGPETVGDTIVGTPCGDTIRAPRGITTVFGEGGNDTLFGQRGNDSLFGGEGNDRLYGGIGDDHPRGGPGDDMLSGGFGADSLDGEGDSDFVRGDATIDAIFDTGSAVDIDILSYATGATPGFPNDEPNYDGFPGDANGRGVYIDLVQGFANNGLAPAGGGVDTDLDGESFETVIGTPFPDFIVGSPDAETIYGGGGADVILGEGGADTIDGGAEGDNCAADPGSSIDCEESGDEVGPRDPGGIAVGLMTPPGAGPLALYVTGSDVDDEVTASYVASTDTIEGAVTFTLGDGSDADFDPSAIEGCDPPAAGQVVCPLPLAETPDSILIAGLGGDDTLSGAGFPETTSLVLLGGDGGDGLTGGEAEDVLIDGAGGDFVEAGGRDDAVPNNDGRDDLHAGAGEDLFISDSVCEGDLLDGGPNRDNANWANFDSAIAIDMGAEVAGLAGPPGGQPQCGGNPPTTLQAIEDTEGTSLADTLLGDAGPNQLLGRLGADTYFAAAGDDSILANSGTPVDDPDPTIDCGEGWDTAQIDHPENGPDAAPIACESIHERDPNSFRPPDTPTAVPPDATQSSTAPAPPRTLRDRTPPRTRILHRPGKTVFTARRRRVVAFAFASNETDATFRCKLDRDRFRPCRSPRAYRLRPGRHTFRIFAVDAAGNRDRTPAAFQLKVRRR